MRKSWIALAGLILLAVLAVGYLRKVPSPPSKPAPPVETPEPQPIPPATHRDDTRAAAPAEAVEPEAEPSHTIDRPVLPPATSSSDAAPVPVPAPAPVPVPVQVQVPVPAAVESSGAAVPHQPGERAAPPIVAPPVPKPQAIDDPESDRRPPVLQSLRFDPPEVHNGGTAILTIGATDDLSGVKAAAGTIRSPSETAEVPFAARDAGGNGVFTATIAISQQAEAGFWFVASLQLVDKADNPMSVSFTKATVPGGGALRVVSEDSDSKAPDVHRVFVEKGTVSGGEKNRIAIDVDDDSSGVASVAGMFQSPSKSAFIPFNCAPSGEGSWAGDVLVPANADCGEWTLWQLRVADKANNRAVLAVDSPQLGRVTFVVSGGGSCDSDAPILDTLFVSPGVVSNSSATEVVLTFTVHDEAGRVGALSGRVDGPASASGRPPTIFFSAPPGPKIPDAPIVVRINVPQYAAQGIWRVALVQLTDDARNTRSYHVTDPALASAFFTVE